MSHNCGVGNSNVVEKGVGVCGQRIQRKLIFAWLRRVAEPHLIRNDNAVPIFEENFDSRNSSRATEVLAVDKEDVSFLGSVWSYIHV